MIRFFTNYSYGGYEELYLGNMADTEEYRYHLPLLDVKKARLNDNPTDEKLKKEVERLSQYPLILRHGANKEATMPDGVFVHVSNPGCKILYRRLGSYYVIVVSDIVGNDHDEMGGGNRVNPFTMLFIGEEEDCPLLDVLAWQLLANENNIINFIGDTIEYDPVANGLRFSLRKMQDKLTSMKEKKVMGINHTKDVQLMVLSEGFELDYALKAQKLQDAALGSVYNYDGSWKNGSRIQEKTEVPPQPQPQPHPQPQPVVVDTRNGQNGTGANSKHGQGKSLNDLLSAFKSLPRYYRIAIITALAVAFILGAIIL